MIKTLLGVIVLIFGLAEAAKANNGLTVQGGNTKCGENEVKTPSGCWNSCSDPRFAQCADFFPLLYNPSFCAYTKDGRYVNYTFECQACKNNPDVIAVRNGACSCEFLKCGSNQVCQEGQCVESTRTPVVGGGGSKISGKACKGNCKGRCAKCQARKSGSTTTTPTTPSEPIVTTDPCASVRCSEGFFCNNGDCMDKCAMMRCASGTCSKGQCAPSVVSTNPCALVLCNVGEYCQSGKCYLKEQVQFSGEYTTDITVDTDMRIKFDGTRVSLVNGCNLQSAEYKASTDSSFSVGLFISTRMACQFDQDSVYVNALTKSTKWMKNSDNQLIFSDSNGAHTITLTPYDPAPTPVSLAGKYSTNIPKISSLVVELTESSLSLQGTCNAHSAQYKASSNGQFSLGAIASTKRMCIADWDSYYIEPLSTSTSFTTNPDTNELTFKNSKGETTIILTPIIDKCMTMRCKSGTRCENGRCVEDVVVAVDSSCAAVTCKTGTSCVNGKCVSTRTTSGKTDPCAGVFCIATTTCVNGKCVPIKENIRHGV